MIQLTVGTRVYNKGDMANIDHFGTISDIVTNRWGTEYEITPDPESARTDPYWVAITVFSAKYEGHGGTRFVTEDAYQTWREAEIAKMTDWRRRLGMEL